MPIKTYRNSSTGGLIVEPTYDNITRDTAEPLPQSYANLTVVADATITVTGSGTTTVTMTKTSGTSAWNAQAYVSTGFNAPCTIEFTKLAGVSDNGASYAMICWNEDPTTDSNYTSLDHASYPFRTSGYQVYNNGSLVLDTGTWSTASTFYIVYGLDGLIKHYNGSTLLYTSASYGTGKTVYLDTSFYSVNSTFSKFSDVKVSNKAWNGTSYT